MSSSSKTARKKSRKASSSSSSTPEQVGKRPFVDTDTDTTETPAAAAAAAAAVATATAATHKVTLRSDCLVCGRAYASILLAPCGHLCCCDTCWERHFSSKSIDAGKQVECPICHVAITRIVFFGQASIMRAFEKLPNRNEAFRALAEKVFEHMLTGWPLTYIEEHSDSPRKVPFSHP